MGQGSSRTGAAERGSREFSRSALTYGLGTYRFTIATATAVYAEVQSVPS